MRLSIGSKIKEAREEKGITQARLAKAIGITPSFVSRIEAGDREVSLELLRRMARVLERPLHYFIPDINAGGSVQIDYYLPNTLAEIYSSGGEVMASETNVLQVPRDIARLCLGIDDASSYFMYQLGTDSMAQAGLPLGAWCVVERFTSQDDAAYGDVVVALYKRAELVRYYYPNDNAITLATEAGADGITVQSDDLTLLGRVVSVITRPKPGV